MVHRNDAGLPQTPQISCIEREEEVFSDHTHFFCPFGAAFSDTYCTSPAISASVASPTPTLTSIASDQNIKDYVHSMLASVF